MLRWLLVVSILLLVSLSLIAQTPTATIDGRILDVSKAVVQGATVEAVNINTNTKYITQTNINGLFTIVNLPPGIYRLEISKPGFRTIVKPNIVLHVQDMIALNFEMSVGSVLESVTVEAGAPLVNAESPAVATVVDRNFADNLPMNGRSFQTLIELTPGVVVTPSTSGDSGQFSVNGQRSASNYFTIDGVSAGVGITSTAAGGVTNNGAAGAQIGFSVQGGTNSLVSVDALQEFRIQTSTYAPEFGRTPGGQISVVTRSGTNRLHGSAFDFLRNDVLDASDWFNGFTNNPPLPKAEERQNDFGGTLGGPLVRDRTFFFFSYEGLRLRLPQTSLNAVPDINVRQNAIPPMQPFLNAYPKPNGSEITDSQGNPTGLAHFNASYSDRSSLDATSLRIDQRLTGKLLLFGRYNYSPSLLVQRPPNRSLNSVLTSSTTIQTLTAGATWAISNIVNTDVRFNYSHVSAKSSFQLDNFGGAVPLTASALAFPSQFTPTNSFFAFQTFDGAGGLFQGRRADNLQEQFNIVDSLSWQLGSHALKFGVDYRRLLPSTNPPEYVQQPFFLDVNSAANGQMFFLVLQAGRNSALLLQNLGGYAQDTWRVVPRLTLTYGLRWDVDYAPRSRSGPPLLSVTGFNDLSTLALAPSGTPVFQTRFNSVAPRFGLNYQLSGRQGWQTVLRGGFGQFFDLSTTDAGAVTDSSTYPFGASQFTCCSTSFPLDPAAAAPPPISIASITTGLLYAFDPHLRLPYTWQWNVALEQELRSNQSLSLSYVGSAGRKLLQTEFVNSPNPNFGVANLEGNRGTSDYDALQAQFQRRSRGGLQTLASYTWAHSIDTASASSTAFNGSRSNSFDRQLGTRTRGPSDFDVRHAVSVGISYDVPFHRVTRFVTPVLSNWSVESILQARSAPPIDVFDSSFDLFGNTAAFRPDLVPNQPLYLHGPQYPGGKALNKAAFSEPLDPSTGQPLRQGDLGRNALRGFGAWQWDFALHRDFPIRETVRLQFRAELFNILNHPNFGLPVGDLSNAQFGQAIQMLGRSLNQNEGGGGLSALYQIGGPRNVQIALRLVF